MQTSNTIEERHSAVALRTPDCRVVQSNRFRDPDLPAHINDYERIIRTSEGARERHI